MLQSATRIRPQTTAANAKKVRPRKTPIQRRSKETVTAILEASAHILERDGLSRFNTNAVALRAGVSIGSLYQFFPSKDAILVALIEKYETGMFVQFQETFAQIRGCSLEQSLRKLVRTMVATHRDRPALHRILEAEEDRLIDSATLQPVDQQLREMLVVVLREHRSILRGRPMRETAEDLIWIVRALVNGTLARGETRWDRVERRLVRAVKGYLLG